MSEANIPFISSLPKFFLHISINIFCISDNFNVFGLESKQNYYVNYSIQGQKYPRSYKYNLNYAKDKYSFIGIDACIEPGPRRPFNFVGILKERELNHVIDLIDQAQYEGVNYTIWFVHFI